MFSWIGKFCDTCLISPVSINPGLCSHVLSYYTSLFTWYIPYTVRELPKTVNKFVIFSWLLYHCFLSIIIPIVCIIPCNYWTSFAIEIIQIFAVYVSLWRYRITLQLHIVCVLCVRCPPMIDIRHLDTCTYVHYPSQETHM